MEKIVYLDNTPLSVEWTARAEKALSKRDEPLRVQMELVFTCMTHKTVSFPQVDEGDMVCVTDNLRVGFRAVTKQVCGFDDADKPRFEPTEVHYRGQYSPGWLKLDYVKGQWSGKFGFEKSRK